MTRICRVYAAFCMVIVTIFFFLLLFSSCVDKAKDSTEPAEVTRAEDDHHLITVPLNNQSEPAVSTGTWAGFWAVSARVLAGGSRLSWLVVQFLPASHRSLLLTLPSFQLGSPAALIFPCLSSTWLSRGMCDWAGFASFPHLGFGDWAWEKQHHFWYQTRLLVTDCGNLEKWCNITGAEASHLDNKAGLGFPGGSVIKNPRANAGDADSVIGSGRSREEGHGNPLRYSCLENPMDRGAWQAVVHGVVKSWTWLKWLKKTNNSWFIVWSS